MQLLDITRKDLLQAMRSLSAIMFMFVVPVLVTVLFFFMFGGGGGSEFTVSRTTVVIVNLDQGSMPAQTGGLPALSGDLGAELRDATSLGDALAKLLQSSRFSDLLQTSTVTTGAAARAAVDAQQAAVAVIIPPDFSAALAGGETATAVEVYRDPTLTLGPSIVESLVRQTVDRFVASTIGTRVVLEQAAQAGVPITDALIDRVVDQHTAAAAVQGNQDDGLSNLVTLQEPPGVNVGVNFLAELLGAVLSGMMVFFVFFTGASTIETILVESEKGTLQRLFTTPVPRPIILGGKGLGTLITLLVQVTVLMTFGVIVFHIDWGQPLPVALAAGALIVLATATGLFLVSFLQTTRQSGVIFGGLLTLTGMLGMIPVFAGGVSASSLVNVIALLVPQGWAIRALSIAREGGSVPDLLPTLAVIALWTAIFAAIGLRRLQQRFA